MWIHESFANYAEGIYTECQDGKQAGAEYIIGSRRNIQNDSPIIGKYGVNNEGSGDMYYKGGSMLHTMRQLVDNDEKWRRVLRGLSSTFWHQTVTTAQIESYMSRTAGMDFSKIFDQYLRTTMIPTLEYKVDADKLSYRWTNVVKGFAMPVRATVGQGKAEWIRPTEAWKRYPSAVTRSDSLTVDPSFYIRVKPPTP
jgi:aminopeptidase N